MIYKMYKYTIKNKNISTVNDYLLLPKGERETRVWFWPGPWYLSPYAMSFEIGTGDDPLCIGGEWGKFHAEIKKMYPIQYFLRNYSQWPPISYLGFCYNSFYENYIYPCKCFFNSRNKHIQKQIPNTWKDSGEIIKDVLYAIFEKEYLPDKKDHWRQGESNAEKPGGIWYEKSLEFDACYKWFNQDRKALELELESAWENLPNGKDLHYDQKYHLVDKLEKEIDKGDAKYLSWIVENKKLLS
jgi:hypothetical protein